MTYRVVIRGENYEHVIAMGKTRAQADRIADDADLNLNHDAYTVEVEEDQHPAADALLWPPPHETDEPHYDREGPQS